MSSQGEEREQGLGGRWEARGGVTGWSGGSLQILWRRQDGVMASLGCPRRRDRPLGAKRAAQMKAARGGAGTRDRPVSSPEAPWRVDACARAEATRSKQVIPPTALLEAGTGRQTSGGHLAYDGVEGVEATALGGDCGAGEREGRGSLPSFLHQASEPGTSDSVCRAAGHNRSHLVHEPSCNILLGTR